MRVHCDLVKIIFDCLFVFGATSSLVKILSDGDKIILVDVVCF